MRHHRHCPVKREIQTWVTCDAPSCDVDSHGLRYQLSAAEADDFADIFAKIDVFGFSASLLNDIFVVSEKILIRLGWTVMLPVHYCPKCNPNNLKTQTYPNQKTTQDISQ